MTHTGSGAPPAAVVFDVLGTLVDQRGSLRELVRGAVGFSIDDAEDVTTAWLDHVADQEHLIVDGRRSFAPSHELDAEALDALVRADAIPAGAVTRLRTASQRLRGWHGSADAVSALAAERPVMGLSNASRRTLAGLSAGIGLRWHQVLSAEDAETYKPSSALYRLALDAAPADSPPPYMVAAHAWDLRAAAAVGMRTAYVPRPDGDPPRPDDAFDVFASDLHDLRRRLRQLDG